MRKLATICRIDEIRPIPDADKIECAVVGGWSVVVKSGEFKANELAIYCEIDSWIPNDVAPFLTKPGHPVKEYEGIPGARLRTVKLRGQLSQGLLLPLEPICSMIESFLFEGLDVSVPLGIVKYEPPLAACLGGMAKGNFPTAVPKTDQERCQNLKREIEKWSASDLRWEITEKLDGSSCTLYMDLESQLHVCSRNLDLTETEGNSFWDIANKYDLKTKMLNFTGLAIQGELVGPGIQGNRYNLSQHEFFVFDVYNTLTGKYLTGIERVALANLLGLKHCPVLFTSVYICSELFGVGGIDGLLKFAEAKSVLNAKTEREGVVFKCESDPGISFKAISNLFLLKGGD